ncbi:hypothetical protein C0993_005714 [Termitomyces sp. T159_Od127]|nr:hypothetical protein C0993_005714 [Termitomyces sp. T159_Od127]
MTIEAGNTYILVNAKSGTVLDLSGTDGYSVLGWNQHGGDNQKWELSHENNQWVFRNVGSGKYLGIAEGEISNNHPVHGVNDPVQWDIFPDHDDESVYRIFVPGTRFNIDLSDHGNPDNGTPVALWGKWQPGVNQTWRFEQGKYRLDQAS